MDSRSKTEEARQAINAGADELDMVINIGWLKEGRLIDVALDIASVCVAADSRLVKVIIEVGLLSEEEKVAACTRGPESRELVTSRPVRGLSRDR